ncbi:MAG: penicillin-binding protein 1A [Vicinamibacterales bacterium]
MATLAMKFARHAGIAALFVGAALAGTLSGVLFAYSDDLPQISALDDYVPSTITRVLDRNGRTVGEFAVERRVVIGYEDVPVHLRQAILAAEDSDFFEHFGLSVQRIMLTLIRDAMEMRLAAGASTLTQQLARKLFLTDEKTWERKIKEALLTIQIEKRYTKEEIFTFYCNQMYFGHGAYGVEAASELYFAKHVQELDLGEAALIAGILQGNVRQSPYVNMDAALRRRNYTLQRMAEEGFITPEESAAAQAKPIITRGDPGQNSSSAPYFLEEVRKYLEARYGATALYKSGMTVRTSLDLDLQEAANKAVDAGLRAIDKRRGWRTPTENVLEAGDTLDDYTNSRWNRPLAEGDIVPALVTGVDAGNATLRIGRLSATLTRDGFRWTRRSRATDLVKPGDVIQVALTGVQPEEHTASVTLEQTPVVEGALVALDNKTGQVLAMVGGYSFGRSQFNRATQARRQMGSTFKPILYTAAIDRGLTPATQIIDAPTEFDAGPDQPPYRPHNYDGTYEGPITLRRALEDSRNIPAVRVMEMLGPPQVVSYARRFGFETAFPPFLSTALGAGEATLLEVASAYSAFPNHGLRMQPYEVLSITDREGARLEENRPEPRDALRGDTAYVMTTLLQGVVQRGTGVAARSLDWPLAGKTGTVDDYTDAWFVGFDPLITIGVWTGYDEKKQVGRETGATAALPIWIDTMRAHITHARETLEETPTFDPPGNIVFMTVDKATGEPVAPSTPGALYEAFIQGTQPAREGRY